VPNFSFVAPAINLFFICCICVHSKINDDDAALRTHPMTLSVHVFIAKLIPFCRPN